MIIHDSFKAGLSRLDSSILSKFDIRFNITDEELLDRFYGILKTPELEKYSVPTMNNRTIKMLDLINKIVGIDEQFIWTNIGMIPRQPFITSINDSLSIEEELFVKGQIIRLCSRTKLSLLGLSNIGNKALEYFECIGYELDGFSIANNVLLKGKIVYVKDIYGTIFGFPQRAFTKSRKKSLSGIFDDQLRKKIKEEILKNRQDTMDNASRLCRDLFNSFCDASRKLEDIMCQDIDAEIEKAVEKSKNLTNNLLKIDQVRDVFIDNNLLRVITYQLFSEQDKKYPIGSYNIEIFMDKSYIKIYNKDIDSFGNKQHMHIDSNGSCCLGEWSNPISFAFKKRDYYLLVLTILEFLEHYNDGSPYIGRDSFIERWGERFKKALKEEAKVKKNEQDKKKELINKEHSNNTEDNIEEDEEDLIYNPNMKNEEFIELFRRNRERIDTEIILEVDKISYSHARYIYEEFYSKDNGYDVLGYEDWKMGLHYGYDYDDRGRPFRAKEPPRHDRLTGRNRLSATTFPIDTTSATVVWNDSSNITTNF